MKCNQSCPGTDGLSLESVLQQISLCLQYSSQYSASIIIILLIWVFLTSVSWWLSTGVWVIANLPKSPGLLLFWSITTMLLWYHPSYSWDLVIRFYLKIAEKFVLLISRRDSGLCIYHLFVWSNLSFLHNSQLITLPTQLCLVFYCFCTNLLHSLIMWLIVSSLSPHILHLLFCCV